MKIAFLFDDSLELGGTQRVINSLANYFVTYYDYEVELINFYRKSDKKHFEYDPKVKITYLNIFLKYKNFLLKYKEKLRSLKVLKGYLKEQKYDIVIGMSARFNIYLVQVKKELNSKLIGTEHIFYDGHSLKTKLKKRLYYNKLDILSVLTDYDYEKYSKFLNNLVKIHNPIPDAFKFKEYNKNSKKILAAGRLTKQKGFDMLLKAMPAVIKKHPDWKLEIFGQGQEKEELENLINILKLNDNVEIMDYVENFYEITDNYSFYVMSSRYEAFPCVLIETQAKGLPAVSFDCLTGPGEIINNEKDGLLVEPENIEKLSKAITRMIEDDNMRIEMSEKAVKNSERFLIKKICSEWNELFKKLEN